MSEQRDGIATTTKVVIWSAVGAGVGVGSCGMGVLANAAHGNKLSSLLFVTGSVLFFGSVGVLLLALLVLLILTIVRSLNR